MPTGSSLKQNVAPTATTVAIPKRMPSAAGPSTPPFGGPTLYPAIDVPVWWPDALPAIDTSREAAGADAAGRSTIADDVANPRRVSDPLVFSGRQHDGACAALATAAGNPILARLGVRRHRRWPYCFVLVLALGALGGYCCASSGTRSGHARRRAASSVSRRAAALSPLVARTIIVANCCQRFRGHRVQWLCDLYCRKPLPAIPKTPCQWEPNDVVQNHRFPFGLTASHRIAVCRRSRTSHRPAKRRGAYWPRIARRCTISCTSERSRNAGLSTGRRSPSSSRRSAVDRGRPVA